MKTLLFFLVLLLTSTGVARPVLRVVQSLQAGTPLLRNGSFEQLIQEQLTAWSASPQGFTHSRDEGRATSAAIRCESATTRSWFGAAQTITLHRTNAAPLRVRGWSKARQVSGGADSDYSLYVDLTYSDGTPLWGQTANFATGTHDWQPREFIILPEKPVRTLTLHCLFRHHSGTVWFDDVSVEEVTAGDNAVLFQGVPVVSDPIAPAEPASTPTTLSTGDGLMLRWKGAAFGPLESVRAEGRVLPGTTATGGVFLARDVATNSDFCDFRDGRCDELGLSLQARAETTARGVRIEGRLNDLTGTDRAVTLVFALPLDALGWHWGDDIRGARRISGRGEFGRPVSVRCGSTGTLSLYPVAAVWDDQSGLALALDMAAPAVYRVGYHAGLKRLFIAYDFGLVRETQRFPSSARFQFVLYRFPPGWGFRAAWQKYAEIFPDYFTVRADKQGIWMPFTDVSKVEGWRDFGFKFHEGNNNVGFDDTNGILSFRYTEPMTWWMRMPKDRPRTPDEARRIRDELAGGRNESQRRLAEVSRVAAMFDEAGQPALLFRNEPWCDGAVWSLNPNPHLNAAGAGAGAKGEPDSSRVLTNAATVHWNEAIKTQLYGSRARHQLDGEYLDSLEGYVTSELNFRREHFVHTTVPLTFSTDTRRPVLFKGLAVYEFTRWMAEEVHRMGKLMFANGVPYRFTFLCPWLDVLGTETDWLRAGRYQPPPLATMDLWRTGSGAKPYLLLMNSDYDQFTPERVEQYFQRALFYGMWPGFFSHNAADNPYWQNPRWYNRDRPLFRKYLPAIQPVAEAGWAAVTHAHCSNDSILIERFGPRAGGAVYFTLLNRASKGERGTLMVDWPALQRAPATRARDLLSGQPLPRQGGSWEISLASEAATAVLLE